MFEGMIRSVFKNAIGVDAAEPVPGDGLTPTRCACTAPTSPTCASSCEFTDLTDVMKDVDFKVFSGAGQHAKAAAWSALRVPGGGAMPRGEIDAYTEFVAIYGAKGLAWIKVNDVAKGRDGLQSPIVKNLHDAALAADPRAHRRAERRPDLLRRRQGEGRQRRDRRAAREDRPQRSSARRTACSKTSWKPLWVVDFPMFEYDEEAQRWNAAHHPFTAPEGRPRGLLETDPGRAASPRPTTWC